MLTDTPRVAGPFVATGASQVVPFAFRVFDATQLEVVSRNAETGAVTELTQDIQYTVSANTDQAANPGGSVTITGTAGRHIYILGSTLRTQDIALLDQGRVWPQSIEGALDRMTAIIQEFDEKLDRAIVAPIGGDDDDTATTLQEIVDQLTALQAEVANIETGGIGTLQYQALLARIAVLESGVTPPAPAPPPAPAGKPMQIFWIDVEGGAATLLVAPGGQTLLMDAGWGDARGGAARVVPVLAAA